MKKVLRLLCPPIVFKVVEKLKQSIPAGNKGKYYRPESKDNQELDIYWTEQMANQLEEWGRDHTWKEIECLLVNCKGKVLDIACGTGVNILDMQRFDLLDIYGFDISDLLIKRAVDKGIDAKKLKVADATKTDYADNEFDYSYSIGSLEHFTEEGIDQFLKEASRYTSKASFHMIPVSASDKNEGWMRTNQSFHNNSVAWWLSKYQKHFSKVYVLGSGWKDEQLSVGKWFVCYK
jgi:ubiquinone/menaquinone biosynthesis C-methylase UbiE